MFVTLWYFVVCVQWSTSYQLHSQQVTQLTYLLFFTYFILYLLFYS